MLDMLSDPLWWRIFIGLCLVYFIGHSLGYSSGYRVARNFYFVRKDDQDPT